MMFEFFAEAKLGVQSLTVESKAFHIFGKH
jgi:hypothetical protein